MIKRGLVAIILFSMMLHCATRMGFLSYLYQQRHQIAYSLGVIAEMPIAMCSHQYELNKGLTIETGSQENSDLPLTVFQTHDITLFFQIAVFDFEPRKECPIKKHLAFDCERKYTPPGFSIFHPPS